MNITFLHLIYLDMLHLHEKIFGLKDRCKFIIFFASKNTLAFRDFFGK